MRTRANQKCQLYQKPWESWNGFCCLWQGLAAPQAAAGELENTFTGTRPIAENINTQEQLSH